MNLKALVLTSTSYRHTYFTNVVSRHFHVPFTFVEAKMKYYTEQRDLSGDVRQHFQRISESERVWFHKDGRQPGSEVREVIDINSPDLVAWARAQDYDIVCLFGASILKQGWIEAFPNKIVNLHLGLSPYYRGSATLFWPFADRKLEYLGATIHLAAGKVDAGAVIKRVYADIRPSENYYDITHRLIRDSIDQFPSAVAQYVSGQVVPEPQDTTVGSLFRKSDFTPEALRRALDYVGNGLSEGEIIRLRDLR